jgi:hypothetical protein
LSKTPSLAHHLQTSPSNVEFQKCVTMLVDHLRRGCVSPNLFRKYSSKRSYKASIWCSEWVQNEGHCVQATISQSYSPLSVSASPLIQTPPTTCKHEKKMLHDERECGEGEPGVFDLEERHVVDAQRRTVGRRDSWIQSM